MKKLAEGTARSTKHAARTICLKYCGMVVQLAPRPGPVSSGSPDGRATRKSSLLRTTRGRSRARARPAGRLKGAAGLRSPHCCAGEDPGRGPSSVGASPVRGPRASGPGARGRGCTEVPAAAAAAAVAAAAAAAAAAAEGSSCFGGQTGRYSQIPHTCPAQGAKQGRLQRAGTGGQPPRKESWSGYRSCRATSRS